ncbi:30S ribosomal protein S15 [Mycoplasma sp. CSL10137]|uniref:30S ribosomal protein S15 n=1 Tax=unclassified Mycoplasma TaxID=2683645 RepID=UPI00197B177A|nr:MULTISPECIES: 30S ribosomal protein S15 [unclassified Mycoplasma]MBN4083744.1 30S ribosomal protein S15 [Mycoplasma sp. CSL10137]MBN4084624.1 30S ribosomal protein S15 [Mycoplasma sp. CSL10166]MBU4693102.1 30S ribosomal protein S15 [Mycoplasma sp. CSL7491-lung]MCU4706796.1 30S ribosomal protein S15 [Mycoplasma sp. CSL7503-lung]
MVSKTRKAELVSQFGKNAKDTGNVSVQIAILTEDIEKLKPHFSNNPKDNHSRRGFLAKISQRKVLLKHLKASDLNEYNKVTDLLKIRK